MLQVLDQSEMFSAERPTPKVPVLLESTSKDFLKGENNVTGT